MDKHYGFIYLTTNLINGKQYIGQHRINNQKTLDPQYFGSGTAISHSIKLHGKENFKREILCFCESSEELNEYEIYFINEFNAVIDRNFYNCAEGGSNGNNFAGKTKEEIEEIVKKRNNTINNKSIEERKETSKKISKSIKERWKNKNFKNNMIIKRSCENSPMAKSVYCVELNIVFSYIRLAERYCVNILNSSIPSHIRHVCRGGRNSTGMLKNGVKLTWKYVEDVDEETLKNAIYIDSEKYNELLSKM